MVFNNLTSSLGLVLVVCDGICYVISAHIIHNEVSIHRASPVHSLHWLAMYRAGK